MPIQEIRRANLQRLVDVSSVSDVAKRSGRPISQICDVLYARKAFGEKLARRLENELELQPGELDQVRQSGVLPVEDLHVYKVPLVTWNTAASPTPTVTEVLLSVINRPNSIALRIEDASMFPLLNPGDLVVCEKDVKPAPGKYVLAQIAPEAAPVLRRYKQTSMTTFDLVPENPDYPTIKSTEAEIRLLGVMVESTKFW